MKYITTKMFDASIKRKSDLVLDDDMLIVTSIARTPTYHGYHGCHGTIAIAPDKLTATDDKAALAINGYVPGVILIVHATPVRMMHRNFVNWKTTFAYDGSTLLEANPTNHVYNTALRLNITNYGLKPMLDHEVEAIMPIIAKRKYMKFVITQIMNPEVK